MRVIGACYLQIFAELERCQDTWTARSTVYTWNTGDCRGSICLNRFWKWDFFDVFSFCLPDDHTRIRLFKRPLLPNELDALEKSAK